MDEDSSKLTTFGTPFGRYRFTVLPFGLHSALEVFHKRVDHHFQPMQQVETDIDDFLTWGKNEDDHDEILIRCLEKAQEIGITMNIKKCQFRKTELVYLGHKVTADRVWADESKIKAIAEMPRPTDKLGVQRLVGMLNYVVKFLPNMSEIMQPLRNLIKNEERWEWKKIHDDSFQKIKDLLTSKKGLAYYDVKKSVEIQVDAYKTG